MIDNTSKPLCKGCSTSVRVSETEVRKMLDEMQLSGAQMVSEDTYQSRMAICGECEAFAYKTTCKYCGCLIAIRAWLADKPCPHPGQPKW